jgi:hypothetical protein
MLGVLLKYVGVVANGLRLLEALNDSFCDSGFLGDGEGFANLFLEFIVIFDQFD